MSGLPGGEGPRRYQKISVESADGVTTVTLSNPARKNALGPVLINELLYALGDAEADPSSRVLVLTGAGDAFSSGGDFSSAGEPSDLVPKGDFSDLLLALVRFEKPTIAKVNGVAMGGGLGLVAACHFAIASETAMFGTPEINMGLFPMMIMAVLARVVPQRALLSMMLLGDKFDAPKALSLGLVGQIEPRERLDEATGELALRLAKKSPAALKLGLRAFAVQGDLALDKALPELRDRLLECLATEDAREGIMAFFEKRTPMWRGR